MEPNDDVQVDSAPPSIPPDPVNSTTHRKRFHAAFGSVPEQLERGESCCAHNSLNITENQEFATNFERTQSATGKSLRKSDSTEDNRAQQTY